MNTTIIFILSFIDIFSEVIELTYEAGVMAGKVIIPMMVFTYVASEYMVSQITNGFNNTKALWELGSFAY